MYKSLETAELLSLSCLEGVYFAGGDKKLQHSARKIGRAIGLAFQVYDDILNFTVGLDEADKPILTDFRQGIYTLPLLLAREVNDEAIAPYSVSLYYFCQKQIAFESIHPEEFFSLIEHF